MATDPGHELDPAGRGHMRASHADREQAIDVLKTAYAQGRLTMDELDARVAQTVAARTYAELTVVTADLPGGQLTAAQAPAIPETAMPAEPAKATSQGWLTMELRPQVAH